LKCSGKDSERVKGQSFCGKFYFRNKVNGKGYQRQGSESYTSSGKKTLD
jgi:hypothetical protein